MNFTVLCDKLNGMGMQEIGEYLISVGAKGRMGCEITCVVADYIVRTCGLPVNSVSVDTWSMRSYHQETTVLVAQVVCSESVQDFLEAFDDGLWPELVSSNRY